MTLTDHTQDIAYWLSAESPLNKTLTAFTHRTAQQSMAQAIEQAINNNNHLVVEAPTGIGKTLAYLLPALLSNKKTLIASRTKALQEQLVYKDIPALLSCFPQGKSVAMLKGKENYLSTERLQLARNDLLLMNAKERKELKTIEQWSELTETGDISECPDVALNSTIWKYVATRSNDVIEATDFCAKARHQARKADILVVNQHLLCTDLIMDKEDNTSQFWREFEAIIIDEAHAMPETAALIFSQQSSLKHLQNLEEDLTKAVSEEANDAQELLEQMAKVQTLAAQGRQHFIGLEGRLAWLDVLQQRPVISEWVLQIIETLEDLQTLFKTHQKRGKKLMRLAEQIGSELSFWRTLSAPTQDQDEVVIWLELTAQGNYRFYITPMRIAATFKALLAEHNAPWIFTSATLSINNDFTLFKQRMGLKNAEHLHLTSPFDFPTQGLIYHPPDLKDPNDTDHTLTLTRSILPILEATKGRAFFLFTSYRAMNTAADYLEENASFNLLVQGDDSHFKLLDRFKKSSNTVLLATHSFWEGMDVKGAALSCVIIDKLPFASPDDPLVKARAQWYEKSGRNHFMDDTLPRSIISLRQGIGRLIRDTTDKGIFVLGDRRIHTKRYGSIVKQNLPNFSETSDLEAVKSFASTFTNR